MLNLRTILLWLMMLAVPFQGYAAAAMAFCAPEAAQLAVGAVHDHTQHDHGSAHADGNDAADHHAAQSAHDDHSNAAHKCGNCAACHSVGMMPTLDISILHGLPQADLAEPLHAIANVSPRVPHKPPRA
jgi:cytochrome c553